MKHTLPAVSIITCDRCDRSSDKDPSIFGTDAVVTVYAVRTYINDSMGGRNSYDLCTSCLDDVAHALGNLARTDERASVQLQRECLRLLVEAEQGEDTRADFDRLVGEDRVVLDMLWALTRVEP